MPRRSIPERLAQLEAQKQALTARLHKQSRAADTRRQILLGRLLLSTLAAPPQARQDAGDTAAATPDSLRAWLRSALPPTLRQAQDRALFADLLDPAPNPPAQPAAPPAADRLR